MANKILVYSTLGCGYTDVVKAELERDGKDYEEINLSLHPERWDEILEYTDGVKLTPVVIDGEEVTVGVNGIGCVS
ncbi:MAG: glutaredoxin [Chloroflexi bacterium]|nr:glutaredoxin [Chloroflexota bacterium]MCI0822619.1 glutaredoxin [Chloroflexota bacterium]MCI0841193.1 glutaredoxin [Chloroflexota bacterium]